MGIIPDFFPKKESPEEVLKEKILKEKLLRQQKKSSPKKSAKRVSRTKAPTKVKKTEVKTPVIPKAPLNFETATFYSQPVRKIYSRNRWFFFLEDIIALTGTIGLNEYISKLKKSKDYEKNASLVVDLPVNDSGKTKFVECIDIEGFNWLLPLLREDKRTFPGPFPNWIAEISKLPSPSLISESKVN